MSPELQSTLDTMEYKGVSIRGRRPSMLYTDDVLDDFHDCINSRFKDIRENPVVLATKIASLQAWPEEEKPGL